MADVTPSASYSVTLRLEIRNQPGMLGKVTSEIGLLGGDLGAIDIVSVGQGCARPRYHRELPRHQARAESDRWDQSDRGRQTAAPV